MYLDQDETIEALCYIGKKGDEKNKCLLTNKYLIVIRRGRPHYFPVENIHNISLNQRILLLPLISGGIIVPLCLLLIFRNAFHAWPILFLLFGGIFLLYLGFSGQWAITVQTHIKEYDVFINEVSPNLRAFLKFIQNHIQTPKTSSSAHPENLLKIAVSQSEWDQAKDHLHISLPEYQKNGYLQAFTSEMEISLSQKLVSLQKPVVIISLNPFKAAAEIKYESGSDDATKLVPRIYGPFHKDAIEKLEVLKEH